MPGHQHGPLRGRRRGELGRLGRRRRQRLLDEDVLAGVERRAASVVVRRTGVAITIASIVVGEQIRKSRRRRTRRVAAPDLRERFLVAVADPRRLDLGELVQVADEVRAPVAEPDDRDAPARTLRIVRLHVSGPASSGRAALQPKNLASVRSSSQRSSRATSCARTRRPGRGPPRTSRRPRRDLPEAGHARRDEEALEVMGLEVLDLVRDAGPRADKRHVASKTLISCGSSSRLVCRSQRAEARDASPRRACRGRSRSAGARHCRSDVLAMRAPRRCRPSSSGT